MASTGNKDSGPIKVGPPVLDYGTGAQAAYAISTALFKRTRTNQGEYIDVSMLDAAMMLMSTAIADYQYSGKSPIPTGNNSLTRPGYACFPTKQDLLMIGAFTPHQYSQLWRALGEQGKADEVSKHNPAEPYESPNDDRLRLIDLLSTKTASEWEDFLNDRKVPAARVRNLEEALNHEQVKSRALLQNDKNKNDRLVPVAAFDYAEGGPSVRSSVPKVGEHTAEVLGDLGYNLSDITELCQRGIVSI